MNTVWVIDDDAFAAKLTQKQLSVCLPEADISAHADPVACWQSLAKTGGQEVDLIVLDLRMPTMDGITLVRKLANISYPGKLIFCSGQNDRMLAAAQEIAEGQGLEILGSLQKPAQIDAVRSLLERRIDGSAMQANQVSAEDIEFAINRGELCNFYQPKIALADHSFQGVEALVRWLREGDIIGPGAIIPVAEEAGLIGRLTDSVIEQAFADLGYWRGGGLALDVSLNLSTAGLHDLTLPEQLLNYCEMAGVGPETITLELTESKILGQALDSLEILSRMRLLGFNLSIDDFGTGHSSLSQLQRIPFSELKIDHSFVTGVSDSGSLQAIVNSSIQLASQLDLSIVAEGVETEADWDFVKQAGCHLAQGYFMAKPMPAQAIPVWAELWQEKRARLRR